MELITQCDEMNERINRDHSPDEILSSPFSDSVLYYKCKRSLKKLKMDRHDEIIFRLLRFLEEGEYLLNSLLKLL